MKCSLKKFKEMEELPEKQGRKHEELGGITHAKGRQYLKKEGDEPDNST